MAKRDTLFLDLTDAQLTTEYTDLAKEIRNLSGGEIERTRSGGSSVAFRSGALASKNALLKRMLTELQFRDVDGYTEGNFNHGGYYVRQH